MEKIKMFLMIILIVNIFSVISAKTIDFVEPTDVYKISDINNLWNNGATFSAQIRPLTADNIGRIAFQENNWELYTEEIQRNQITLVFKKNFSVSPLVIKLSSSLPKNEWSHVAISYDIENLPTVYLNGKEVEYMITGEPEGFSIDGNSSILFIGNNNSYNNFDGLIKDVMIKRKISDASEIQDLMNRTNSEFFTILERTSVENADEVETFANILSQNFPNPFVASTMISFSLNPNDGKSARIEIFNVKGQKIREYQVSSGQTSIVFDGKDNRGKKIAAGIYFYKLHTNTVQIVKRMIISR